MDMLQQILEMLSPFIMELLAALIALIIVPQLKAIMKQYGIKTFISNEKELVLDTMLFVERLYKHLDGPVKMAKTKQKVISKAGKIGLKIDEEDINELVDTFIEEFNFDWNGE